MTEHHTEAEIRQDIEDARRRLSDTAEALAYKANVPARAREKAGEVRDKAMHTASVAATKSVEALDKAQHAAAVKLPGPVARPAERLIVTVRRNPVPFAVGTVVGIWILRRLLS